MLGESEMRGLGCCACHFRLMWAFPVLNSATPHAQIAKTMNAKTKWSLEADFIQACNCDYGCPCEFSAPPTKGFCEGMGAWRIKGGTYGNVSLDGLGLAFAAHWPKAIHEGNGTCGLLFDERANPQQREALLQICSGKAGGMPFKIIV